MKRNNDDSKKTSINKKRKILKEKVVEHVLKDVKITDDEIVIVEDISDFRTVFGIENGLEIEVEWYLEYADDDEEEDGNYWLDATISKSDTGRNHKFIDEVNSDEFTYTPVVEIKYTDTDDKSDVCFIGANLMYDIDNKCIIAWKKTCDEYPDDDDDDNVNENENDVNFVFHTIEELEEEVNKLVPKIFINVLSKFKVQYESLPFTVRREWDVQIVLIKDKLVKKLIDHFKVLKDTPGIVMTLENSDLERIFDECFNEIDNI